MSLKDTKIYIPEIPKEWKRRTRSGHTNIWNDDFERNGLPNVELEPPQNGLYAERFEDGWYWVCGCNKCLGNNEPYSYIVCEEHNRCITCGTHRKELTEIPWGHPDGFQCKPCRKKENEERKFQALMEARERGHSEDDCYYIEEIICPVCGTENSSDDINGDEEHEVTCCVCDTDFIVTVDYEPRYTSRLKK
ncbi:hypothetical protein M670_00147 [Schinkia azotoformans MEV2011]|uniref:Uncharacterized protein n=1 Tax=Schinkia azotoformans MEV2011 TaxID=1348973 RepID=A0A072NRS6_SCHAZ|nr:hypothetical protein [Schinkia azotoformans]KEF40131.1 hypothetical protein M670_00147 [Schinkia azotoformans MEV2011]MEC1714734.1 hypothetical protein [Schinkia azotoformans]MEC1757510.1 hypothetical protein [Schinkia azotoformans]